MLEATGDPKSYTSDLESVCDTQQGKLELGMFGPSIEAFESVFLGCDALSLAYYSARSMKVLPFFLPLFL